MQTARQLLEQPQVTAKELLAASPDIPEATPFPQLPGPELLGRLQKTAREVIAGMNLPVPTETPPAQPPVPKLDVKQPMMFTERQPTPQYLQSIQTWTDETKRPYWSWYIPPVPKEQDPMGTVTEKVNWLMEMPQSQRTSLMSMQKFTNLYGWPEKLAEKGMHPLAWGDKQTTADMQAAMDHVQAYRNAMDPINAERLFGIGADVGRTAMEFVVPYGAASRVKGAGKIGKTGMAFAGHEALTAPGWEEPSGKLGSIGKAGVTGGAVGLAGKKIPWTALRAPVLMGAFAAKAYKETGDPEAAIEAAIHIAGFELLGITQRAKAKAIKTFEINRLRMGEEKAMEKAMEDLTKDVGKTEEGLKKTPEVIRQEEIAKLPDDLIKPVRPFSRAVDPTTRKGVKPSEAWRVPSEEMQKAAAQAVAQDVAAINAQLEASQSAGSLGTFTARELLTTPRNSIAKLGPEGFNLASGTRRADMIAKGRAATAEVTLDEMFAKLKPKEQTDILKVVNYIQSERFPVYKKRLRINKALGHTKKPISENQRVFAEELLDELNLPIQEAEKMGGTRTMPGGAKIDIKLGGEPSPAMLTKEGQRLFAEAIGAVDLQGKPNLAALRRNRMIVSMVESGRAKNEGEAYKKLNRLMAMMDDKARKSKIGTFDKGKSLLPAEFLEWGYTPVIKEAEHFQKVYGSLELRRQWGWDYEKAYAIRNQLSGKYNEKIMNSIDEWMSLWDQNPVTPPEGIATGIIMNWLPTTLNRWATISKLGVTTSLRNYPERMKSIGEYGLFDFLQAELQAHTPRWIGKRLGMPDYRRMVRAAGAVSKKPEFSGLAAGIPGELGRGKTGKITQAALEYRGFLPIERGNNINAALASRLQAMRDVAVNLPDDTPAGFRHFIKSLWADPVYSAKHLLGETRGAAQRRFARAEFTKAEVKAITERGYMTAEEYNRIMVHGAESKHFRADIFFNPTTWHKNAWYRTAMKFKIPWGWQQINRHIRMCLEEVRHGNLRPLTGYIAATTLGGELYQLATDPLTGNDRSDQAFWERAWGDFLTGGGIAFFENLVYGRTAWQMVANFIGGPTLQTIKGGFDTYQRAKEDPEHIGQYAWEYAQKEITDLRRVDQLIHPKLAESRREGYKIRQWTEEYTETDQAKRYYMDHLYDALKEGDESRAVGVISVLLNEFEGMTPLRIKQSMQSRSPLSGVSRREMVQLEEELPKRRGEIVTRRSEEELELIVLLVKILKDNFK